MRPTTLAAIKTDMAKFSKMFDIIEQSFNDGKDNTNRSFPQYTLLAVLISNAAFDATNCVNYSHDEAVSKLHNIEKCIEAMQKYYTDSYLIQMTLSELQCSITANQHAEYEAYESRNY